MPNIIVPANVGRPLRETARGIGGPGTAPPQHAPRPAPRAPLAPSPLAEPPRFSPSSAAFIAQKQHHVSPSTTAFIAQKDRRISELEEELARGFGFLSRKPVLIVLNLAENQTAPQIEYKHQHSQVVALQGKLEMDIAQLPPDEMKLFLDEYGIDEPSLNRMIRLSYDLLGLQSFFTVGPDECRAWTVRRRATVPEAAGEIHTDLQKGSIRAEVVTYTDLVTLGGLAEARHHGKLRLEGKEYIVQDGDVMHFRFNV